MAVNYLVLRDGTVLEGEPFGFEGDSSGEVVFTTSTDYQDSFSDPSNKGNILIFTYPLIGDYGIEKDYQGLDAYPNGIVVREYSREPSEQYHGKDIDTYLREKKIVGISGIDTRSLVIRIREQGTFKGAIVKDKKDAEKAIRELKEEDYVSSVSVKEIMRKDNGKGLLLGVVDCGIRKSFIDELSQRFDINVYPYGTPCKQIVEDGVKGVIISDGPGDPASNADLISKVKCMSSKLPLMGIGYGACIIAEAMGAKTYKMKFGHRGGQSVKHENRILITSQNRGYAIDRDSAEKAGFAIDQVNLNDGTVEGITHKELPVIAVEYHPEVVKGEIGTYFVFDKFEKMMNEGVQ